MPPEGWWWWVSWVCRWNAVWDERRRMRKGMLGHCLLGWEPEKDTDLCLFVSVLVGNLNKAEELRLDTGTDPVRRRHSLIGVMIWSWFSCRPWGNTGGHIKILLGFMVTSPTARSIRVFGFYWIWKPSAAIISGIKRWKSYKSLPFWPYLFKKTEIHFDKDNLT